MKRVQLVGMLVSGVAMVLLSACYTTSISNTGNNHLYRGELSEFDVLGIDAGVSPAGAWKEGGAVRPARGSRILLVQSGAMMPDAALEEAFAKYFTVVPFSGTGDGRGGHAGKVRSLNRQLRTAAAAAGARHVVCVWGKVERESVDHGTKMVSWVPIVGQVVPDETEHQRLSVKAGVIDTRSGAWDAVTARTPVSQKTSNMLQRGAVRTAQVEAAKRVGYVGLAGKVAGRTGE